MATPAIHSEARIASLIESFDAGLDASCDGRNDGREVTLEQYLHTAYSPDCDYIDGRLEERNVGELDHGDVQGQIYFLFRIGFAGWQAKPVVEVRLQVRDRRFLIPDVMVLHPGQKTEQIVREAPLLCVEVLSREDRWSRLRVKVEDYVAMGVKNIWAFDPILREAYRCDAEGFHKVTTPEITIPGTSIGLNVAEVFSVLDSE